MEIGLPFQFRMWEFFNYVKYYVPIKRLNKKKTVGIQLISILTGRAGSIEGILI